MLSNSKIYLDIIKAAFGEFSIGRILIPLYLLKMDLLRLIWFYKQL